MLTYLVTLEIADRLHTLSIRAAGVQTRLDGALEFVDRAGAWLAVCPAGAEITAAVPAAAASSSVP